MAELLDLHLSRDPGWRIPGPMDTVARCGGSPRLACFRRLLGERHQLRCVTASPQPDDGSGYPPLERGDDRSSQLVHSLR